MTVVVDYGVGNRFSILSAFRRLGREAEVSADPEAIRRADRLVLPGVGAFGDAMARLRRGGLDQALREAAGRGAPLLGICLGMQLLLDEGHEYGVCPGLGLLPGRALPLSGLIPASFKLPHTGWNALRFEPAAPMFRFSRPGDFVYFVHSFYAADCPAVCATTSYGKEFAAAVAKDNIWGCQFHPEKSGAAGLGVLRAFCEEAA